METNEPLLKLYREFTDKEKLQSLRQKYNDLKNKYEERNSENIILQRKIKKLKEEIKADSIQYPSTLGGQTYVTVKAYFKLRKRNQELLDRLYELAQEVNKLKKDSDCEKL